MKSLSRSSGVRSTRGFSSSFDNNIKLIQGEFGQLFRASICGVESDSENGLNEAAQ